MTDILPDSFSFHCGGVLGIIAGWGIIFIEFPYNSLGDYFTALIWFGVGGAFFTLFAWLVIAFPTATLLLVVLNTPLQRYRSSPYLTVLSALVVFYVLYIPEIVGNVYEVYGMTAIAVVLLIALLSSVRLSSLRKGKQKNEPSWNITSP